MEDVTEPEVANGYARIQVLRTELGWPLQGDLNGERWIETGWLTWEATGTGFDKPVRRLVLVDSNTEDAVIYAVSSPFPADVTITPATPESDRRFKYRVYLR